MCIAFGGDRQQSPWAWLGCCTSESARKDWGRMELLCSRSIAEARDECDADMFFKSPNRSFYSFDVGCFWVYTQSEKKFIEATLLTLRARIAPQRYQIWIEGFYRNSTPQSLQSFFHQSFGLKSLIYCRCVCVICTRHVPAAQCLQEALGVSWCFRPRGGVNDLADWLFIATRKSMDWFFDTMKEVQRHCAQADRSLAMGLKA